MPCPSSIYCISNTGVPLYNDSYEDTLTNYNGVQYYTGQTNGLFIYYSSGDTQWCLSDTLGGTCYLSGKSPCSTTCPDLCDELFTTGSCPTPTPTPTNNCSSLDFSALFDCDLPPTPSVTPTSTVTPTVTVTPTSTNICPVSFIDATIYSVSPTPTPTPTMTPTPSMMVERDCTFSGTVTYDMINDDIVCPFSYEFQECFGSGRKFYTFDTLETPSGEDIEEFMVFNASVLVGGTSIPENLCIHYIGFNNQISGTDHITLLSDYYGFANRGECNFCNEVNTPTPTPTPTVTPTITLTPTVTVSITPTNTVTPTNTATPTITPSQTLPLLCDTPKFSGTGILNSSILDSFVYTIAKQSDGKFILGGSFRSYNGSPSYSIVRVNPDGSKDFSFNVGTGTLYGGNNINSINSISIQPDGRILIGGNFSTFNGVTTQGSLIRLNENGTTDLTFNGGSPTVFGEVYSISQTSLGKIIIGGLLVNYNGISRNGLALLDSNGTLDNTFIPLSFNGNWVNSATEEPGGKILAVGNFSQYGSNTVNCIVKLETNGSLDTTFKNNTGTSFNGGGNVVTVDNNGKILVGGTFTSFNSNPSFRIARLNSNGTFDSTFITGTGFEYGGNLGSPSVNDIIVLPNNQIMVTGQISSYNNIPASIITRLNDNGTKDISFASGAFNSASYGFSIVPYCNNQRYMLGGRWNYYNGLSTAMSIISLKSNGENNR